MRYLIIGLIVTGLLIVAAAVGAGWEIHRLDRDVQSLKAQQGPDPRLDAALTKLTKLGEETAKLREAHLRQELYAPFYALETQYRNAVTSGYSECSTLREQWRDYVNSVVEDVQDQRALRTALRRDDPDYHATLLNAFRC